MDWLEQLLFDSNSIAHIVLLYTAVISIGIYLGKIKFFGISLGVTFVLFAESWRDISDSQVPLQP